jgi:predicted transcriptional regulator
MDMQISALRDLLEAQVLCGEEQLEEEVSTVFSSDMMSDVLACPDEIHCLLTGLINQQVIRTADMMDIGLVVFVRGKRPPEEVVEMARQRDMVVMLTQCRMFTACGRLYVAGMGER